MNIELSTLSTALEIASVALPRKTPAMPLYNSVRIEASEGSLTIAATDGDQYAIGEVGCNSAIEPFCVSAKSLANLLPLMEETIWFEVKESRLHIKSGGNFTLSTSDAAEFPNWDTEGSKAIGVNCEDLSKAIDLVSFASSTDQVNRAVLCSVQVRCSDKEISTMGFNGHELARFTLPAISAKCEFLLPSAMVKNFCDALNQEGAGCWLSDSKATVKHGAGEYSTKLWAGKYPNLTELTRLKKQPLGEINPASWLTILRSCVSDNGDDKCVRVHVGDGFVFHTGPTTQLEVPTPDKLEKCELNLNGKSLVPCLERLEGKASVFLVDGHNAVGFEQGNLMILSTMLVKEGG